MGVHTRRTPREGGVALSQPRTARSWESPRAEPPLSLRGAPPSADTLNSDFLAPEL